MTNSHSSIAQISEAPGAASATGTAFAVPDFYSVLRNMTDNGTVVPQRRTRIVDDADDDDMWDNMPV